MKVILGLGNPNIDYAMTRHNTGIMLVDAIYNLKFEIYKDTYGWRRKKSIMVVEFPEVVLVKTARYFMNESGSVARDFFKTSPLAPLLNFSQVRGFAVGEGKKKEGFFLAHDDLDIHLGEYKIQFGVGPKVHNGVESVEQALGTKDFWRIRIGIDNRLPENRIPGEEYVLQRFTREERELLDKTIDKITHEIIETNS